MSLRMRTQTRTLLAWTFLLLASLLVIPAQAREALPLSDDPVVEARMLAISEELRCLVCQNETLAASRAELAEDLRKEVRRLIRENKTDPEIKEYLVSRYGDFVLYRPPVKPTTWLLWSGPFLLMVAGIAALVAYLRRRGREVKDTPLSDDEAKRATAFLEDGKP
jgi:cytochrome c-type biogenesis protein CcmH